MSAPDTNPRKQARRHRPALIGMAAAVAFALLLYAVFVTYLSATGEDPGRTEGQGDGSAPAQMAVD